METRKTIRLQGYDYSQPGGYFVTICTKDREPYFCRGAHCAPAGEIPPYSDVGKAVKGAIEQIPAHYPGVKVDKYVIMPNHIHMILLLDEQKRRTLCAPTSAISVSRVIRAMKEAVTKKVGYSVWQRSYHDHIIRNQAEYLEIWSYIDTNPARWAEDCYYKEV